MTSDLAMEDIESIMNEGGKVSPQDVVRLNALALKITNSATCDIATLPRVACAYGITFREPTIQQDMFISECSRIFSNDDTSYIAIQAWTLAHDSDDCNEKLLRHPMMFMMRVKLWIMKNLRKATCNELERIIYYVRFGSDPTTGEWPVYMIDDTPYDDEAGSQKSWIVANYLHSVAIGIDSVAALRATSPQLTAMIERAYLHRGAPLGDSEKKATADYYRTLDSIRKKAFPEQETDKKD